MLTLLYVTYGRSVYEYRRLEMLRLQNIIFWYDPEVIPDEPLSYFFSKDSTLALKLQPCWQTVLGQVKARRWISDYDRGLAQGDILHSLVLSVYSVLSGEHITFELKQKSVDFATQRLYEKFKYTGIDAISTRLRDELFRALTWDRAANLPREFLMMCKRLWTALGEESKALQDKRHGFIVPRPATSSH